MTIRKLYDKLYQFYGLQNWWPTKDTKDLEEKRTEIIIGAILTQSTSWKNVEKALDNLAKENLFDFQKLSQISDEKLAELIKPAGFFNVKTKRLRSFTKWYMKNEISNNAQTARKQMLDINGLGPETVDSILLYAFDKPIFVIDAYTKRLVERHQEIFKTKISYDTLQEFFMKNLPKDIKIYQEFHALIVRLAKDFCHKKSCCDNCPLHLSRG